MEVVLPDGDIIRTGQWAVDNSPNAFACRAGFGPQVDGLFLQSNLGIVTKLGIWVQPQPETTMSVCLDMDDLEDLEGLIEILAELRRENIIQNDPSIFNVFRRISRLGPRHKVYPAPGAIPEGVVRDMMKEHGWGYWKTWFSFYGTKDMVLSRLAITQEAVTRISPRSRLIYRLFEGQADGEKVDPTTIPAEWQPTNAGVPTILFASTIDYNTPLGGHGGHVDFSPILPYDGKLTLKWYKEVAEIHRQHGFDSFVGGHAFAKHSVLIHMVLFNRMDKDQMLSAKALWHALAAKAKEYGLTNYRTHLDYMGELTFMLIAPLPHLPPPPSPPLLLLVSSFGELFSLFAHPTLWVKQKIDKFCGLDVVQESYNFNNNAYRRFIETLKVSLEYNRKEKKKRRKKRGGCPKGQ